METSCIGVNIWSVFMQLFSLMIFILASSNPSESNEVDRLSLFAFKSELVRDSQGILSSWNDFSNLCGEWQGITCGRRHQRVTVLDLQSSQLNGILSSLIGNLSFLRTLNLRNNSFSATIPQEIGRLSRLRVLDLSDNSFEGDIPVNISHCFNLQYLVLANNTLSGKLPMELGSLLKLQVLTLRRNNLVGEIPSSLGNLSSLELLSMEENFLHGSIMSSLGKLKSLRILELGLNSFSGTIPPSIYNLSSIQVISVIENGLHGTLPSGLGYRMFPDLQIFQFQMNMFSGKIPSTISNASQLLRFGISGNQFTGEVPSLARLSSLIRLEMDENLLGAEESEDGDINFLSSLTNCTSLQYLDISENKFHGMLPETMSNLSTKLFMMDFRGNQLHGRIPNGIGNLLNLGRISFEANQLSGPIPTSVCNIIGLFTLSFGYNQLTGIIPSCLGNLSMLGNLDLKSNNLQGVIPQSLGQCKSLISLVLARNNLDGSIPREVIAGLPSLSLVLDLSSNHFSGSIPTEVGILNKLGLLDLSGNGLSGELPVSLGSCESLETLRLSQNLLHGTIPESLSSLNALGDLDLSYNSFSGRIPPFFESMPYMQNLNLSFNNFEGEVPKEGIFGNVTAVSLMGNKKLCGEVPEFRLRKCFSKRPRSKSHKLLIPVLCVAMGVSFAACVVLLLRSRKAGALGSIGASVKPSQPSVDISFLNLSYADLLQATNGFSSWNLIGAGSSGSVYWGVLNQPTKRTIAVKVLDLQKQASSTNFIAECEFLKSIRHRNLVKLVTACSSIDFQGNEFKALVFDYMVHGSLDEWLHAPADRIVTFPIVDVQLNLIQRVNIAIDIASALDYLHNYFHTPVVHCDLKPSNILLEDDMTACVCDFGLASYLPNNSDQGSSLHCSYNSVMGTIGYIAPEYGRGSAVSTHGDQYSYGIMLLEMLTGKRPTDEMFSDGINLHNYVVGALPDRVKEICDPVLLQRQNSRTNPNSSENAAQKEAQTIEECLISIARIGVGCSGHFPKSRMEIGKVISELRIIKELLTGTRIPKEHMATS